MPKIQSITIGLPSHPLSGLTITDIPRSARLIVLIGRNGSGKTSILEALRYVVDRRLRAAARGLVDDISVTLHGIGVSDTFDLYMRSAYRTEHAITVNAGNMIIPHWTGPTRPAIPKPLAADTRVQANFSRLLHLAHGIAMRTNTPWTEAVANLFSPTSARLRHMFPYLGICRIDYPTGGNTADSLESLCFEKDGTRYRYDRLSAGEKEVFDLLFDLEMWAHEVPSQNPIYCIDEPELHLHPGLQSELLTHLFAFVPSDTQLWIATHSIGVMRRAMDLHGINPGEVVFLKIDDAVAPPATSRSLRPATVDRRFWKAALGISLGELAGLVAPSTVVICEGRALGSPGKQKKASFDAQVYRKIFATSHPDADFVSGGACSEVENDIFKLASAVEFLIESVRIVKLIDRDTRSPEEIDGLRARGYAILSWASIENYLWSDEILSKLFARYEMSDEQAQRILALKHDDNFADEQLDAMKERAQKLHAELIRMPQFRGKGSTKEEFAKHVLSELVTEDTATFRCLWSDIFGASAPKTK